MPLISPRFRNEPELRHVEANRAALRRGTRGRHVHLLQMALIDLGFAMPISTAGSDVSPDGVYGAETEQAVKAFQGATSGLTVDGTIGQQTIRELDKRFNRFTHRVNLHFRSIALTDVDFDHLMSNAERVYAQYSIEAFFASGESLALPQDEQDRFTVVKQDCNWDLDSGEFAELHRLGSPIPKNDVGVFIVGQFQETNVLGCGGHAAGRPACAVTHDCGPFDVAHEVCHVLLTSTFTPVHTRSARNLMFPTSGSGHEIKMLTDKQLKRIRANPLCRAI